MSSPLPALREALARPGPGRTIAGLVALLAAPLIIALVALTSPRWYPLLDLGLIEMRLRDVGTSHSPLVGLAGRIGDGDRLGSHPGPLGFYAIWPVYRLFGSTAWAMEASAVAVQMLAVGVALWIANRRGGLALVLGLTATLAFLLRAFGAEILTQPWNPYLPVLWWVVFVLAVWSVCCDDLVLLPVAVVAGSLCAQTEVAYFGLTVVLGGAAVAVAAVRAYRRRKDPAQRKRFAIAAAATIGATVLVWLPPIVEELTSSRGNLSVLFDYFLSEPPQQTAGLGNAIHELAVMLNPVTLLTSTILGSTSTILGGVSHSVVPGYLFVAVWTASAVLAWRLRARRLMWLHAVLALALAAGLFSISRIFGVLWYYLILWGWGLNALMLFAIGWTLVLVIRRRLDTAALDRTGRFGRRALVAVTVLVAVVFAVEAAGVKSPSPRLGAQLGDVVEPTVRALERQFGRDKSRRDRFLITFADPNSLGAQGYGLVNELEREGFDVGLLDAFRTSIVSHRVVEVEDATAIVHVSTGADIRTWRAKPEVREVVYSDPRSAKERATYDRLLKKVILEFQTAGLADLASSVDKNLFGVSIDPRVPKGAKRSLARLAQIGLPIAVFIAPPSVGS